MVNREYLWYAITVIDQCETCGENFFFDSHTKYWYVVSLKSKFYMYIINTVNFKIWFIFNSQSNLKHYYWNDLKIIDILFLFVFNLNARKVHEGL